jgi:hypothetical protein
MAKKKKPVLKALEAARLERFKEAFNTLQRFGFTVPEASVLITVQTRTMFRILAGQRPVDLLELSSMQTAAITALHLQQKVLSNQLDLKTVTP